MNTSDKKQNGFALVEILAMLIIISALGLVMNKLFRTLLQELPSATKAIESDTTLNNMLEILGSDMDSAISVQAVTDPNALQHSYVLLQIPGKLIRYDFAKDTISRDITDANRPSSFKTQSSWQSPKSRITWQVGKHDSTIYLEISKHIEQKYSNRTDKKLANSYIFFAGRGALSGESQ